MTERFEPTLLLSMPQLQDPNFSRTVVLLCDYAPEGAFGLVLNRPTEMRASSMGCPPVWSVTCPILEFAASFPTVAWSLRGHERLQRDPHLLHGAKDAVLGRIRLQAQLAADLFDRLSLEVPEHERRTLHPAE